jgi:beta-phosphoglucomutase-like phosphatase (HAD superfamily)
MASLGHGADRSGARGGRGLRLKALIFDVDGTLADTEEAHRRAFNLAFRLQGLKWRWSRPQYAALLKVTGGKERISAYIASLSLSPSERTAAEARIPQLHRLKTDLYVRMVEQGKARMRNGVLRLIEESEACGVTLAIATTTSFENIRALMEKALGEGALTRFRAIGSGDMVPRKKPAPDVYDFVLRSLQLPPTNCVAIEDSRNGLRSAKSAGLFTVVTPSYWTRDEDLSEADLLVSHLGSASEPLPEDEARRLGSSQVGVREIDQWLSRSVSAH